MTSEKFDLISQLHTQSQAELVPVGLYLLANRNVMQKRSKYILKKHAKLVYHITKSSHNSQLIDKILQKGGQVHYEMRRSLYRIVFRHNIIAP